MEQNEFHLRELTGPQNPEERFSAVKKWVSGLIHAGEIRRVTDISTGTERNKVVRLQQGLIKEAMLDLISRSALVSFKESVEYYRVTYGLDYGDYYKPPDQFNLVQAPGGVTRYDYGSRRIKIYLNPFLSQLDLDYRLATLLEERFHYETLLHERRTEVTLQDEIDVKKKVLAMADQLGLSPRLREFEEEMIRRYKAEINKEEP